MLNGVIFYKDGDINKIVLEPDELFDHINYLHSYMHVSAEKTYQQLSHDHHFLKLFAY